VVASIAVVATGCGSSGHPSEHAALPELVYNGGSLVVAPRVVTVTFQDDGMAADLTAFGNAVASSSWWDVVRSDRCDEAGHCLADGPPGTAVQLSSSAPAMLTDSDRGDPSTLQDWLSAALADGSLPPPDPGPPASNPMSSTIYLIYLPETTTVTFDGLTSCAPTGFAGYHNHLTMGGQRVPYAVVSECTPLPPPAGTNLPALTLLQTTTVTASHEILETATDPDGRTGFGLKLDDVDNWAWLDIVGGDEAADLCVDPFGIHQDVIEDPVGGQTFSVQRIWSDASAAAGHDPCVPVPSGEVYFNAAPRKSFFVIDVGQSVTFDVDAFADGPMPDWTLVVQDWSASASGYLDLTVEGGEQTSAGPSIKVNRGRTVRITATLLADPSGLPTGEANGALVSVSGGGASVAAHWWPFAVMSRTEAIQVGITGAKRIPANRPLRATLAATALVP
jgi:hypothetical protein